MEGQTCWLSRWDRYVGLCRLGLGHLYPQSLLHQIE